MMIPPAPPPPPRARAWSWRSQSFRGLVYQILTILLLVLAVSYLMSNTFANMRTRGIQSGFDFFLQPAGFAIGESLFEFDSAQGYWVAYLVGLSNTLRVALVGIVLATLLGTLIGIGRLSNNLLVRGLCAVHVEVTRNVPLLLQLFMWYFAMTELLPTIEAPLKPLAGVFLSKNGLQYPLPEWSAGHWGTVVGLLAGVLAWRFWARRALRQFEATGQYHPARTHFTGVLILLAVTAVGWLAGGRLLMTLVSVQQQHVQAMMEDRLGRRYLRIDAPWPAHAGLGIDVATREASDVLVDMAAHAVAELDQRLLVEAN